MRVEAVLERQERRTAAFLARAAANRAAEAAAREAAVRGALGALETEQRALLGQVYQLQRIEGTCFSSTFSFKFPIKVI